MKFEEVLPALREGKRVRQRKGAWNDWTSFNEMMSVSTKSLLADDWEIEPEPKKPIGLNYPINEENPLECFIFNLANRNMSLWAIDLEIAQQMAQDILVYNEEISALKKELECLHLEAAGESQ
jgi:hypothetical protein